MWLEEEVVFLNLTKREAQELFSRLLKSHDDDNEESKMVLKKLARAIESILELREAS